MISLTDFCDAASRPHNDVTLLQICRRSMTWTLVFQVLLTPLTSTWPHLRCDGLDEGEYREKLSLSCSIVYYFNGAQRYEQFLQVG